MQHSQSNFSLLHCSSSKAAQGWRLYGRTSNDVWTKSIYFHSAVAFLNNNKWRGGFYFPSVLHVCCVNVSSRVWNQMQTGTHTLLTWCDPAFSLLYLHFQKYFKKIWYISSIAAVLMRWYTYQSFSTCLLSGGIIWT